MVDERKSIIYTALYHYEHYYRDQLKEEDLHEHLRVEYEAIAEKAMLIRHWVESQIFEPPKTPLPVRENGVPFVIESELVFTEYFEWFQWSAEGVAMGESSNGEWTQFEIDLSEFNYDDCPYPEFVQTCKALHDAGLDWVLVTHD